MHNVVIGRVYGSVTMAHTIGRIVHGLPWSRVALIVLAALVLVSLIVALAGYTVYRAITPVPQTTVVSVLPAPASTEPPAATTTATTTSTTAATDPFAPDVAVRAERLVVTTNHPTPTTTPTTTAVTTTTVAPTTTSGQSTPTTTTGAAANQCNGSGPWPRCVP